VGGEGSVHVRGGGSKTRGEHWQDGNNLWRKIIGERQSFSKGRKPIFRKSLGVGGSGERKKVGKDETGLSSYENEESWGMPD